MGKSRRSSEAKSLAIFRLSILCLQIVLNGRQNGDLENSDRTWENLLDLKFIVIVDFFADSARSRRYRLWKCPRKIDDFRLDQPNLFNAELSRNASGGNMRCTRWKLVFWRVFQVSRFVFFGICSFETSGFRAKERQVHRF